MSRLKNDQFFPPLTGYIFDANLLLPLPPFYL